MSESIGHVDSVEVDVGSLGPGFPVVVGAAVRLDMELVSTLCIRSTAATLNVFRGKPGIVTSTYRRTGWPLMCVVDFGDDGSFNGPVTMLQSAYSDA